MIERLRVILESWKGTPWRAGQACKGVGADCLQFAVAVLDEWLGVKAPPPPRFAQDAATHDPSVSERMAEILRLRWRYAGGMEAVRDGVVRPGDLIGFRIGKGGDSHVGIVGPERNTIWHCQRPGGVRITGFGLSGVRVGLIGRIVDKARCASVGDL